MLQQQIGFIGAGQMATALAQAMVRAGLTAGKKLLASDPAAEARQRFAQATGAETTESNLDVTVRADVLFLAVKPQQMAGVLAELSGKVGPRRLVISIAPGFCLTKLAEDLGSDVRLVRVMPNMPCLVSQGASGFTLGAAATEEDACLVRQLLEAAGIAFQVEEKLLDAVAGLSGSGPAFVYIMIEALSDGGVRMGLPRPIATALAAQTLRGVAEMVLTTGEHLAVLKDKAICPGGTTIAGIQALERGGLRATLMAAVVTATERAIELGSK